MPENLWPVAAAFLLIVVVPFALIVAACLWERRPVQPYYVPDPADAYAPSADALRSNDAAQRLGYRHAGLCHDGKGKLYRVRYDFWVSPADETVAVVGSGTVAVTPVSGVWLWSRTAEGRILCTTNVAGEQDVSGIENQETRPGWGFAALAERHFKRISEHAIDPFPYDEPLAGYFDIRRQKADALVERGYAYYLDENRSAWRYTLRGASAFYVAGVWVRPLRRLLRSLGLTADPRT